MVDITLLFDQIIEQSGSYDIADSEFKRMIAEDNELRMDYKEWCHQVGSTEKKGFLDYCEEYMEAQGDIWDSLREDYDE